MLNKRLKYIIITTLIALTACRKDVEIFRPYDDSKTEEEIDKLISQTPIAVAGSQFQFSALSRDTVLTAPGGIIVELKDTERLFNDETGAPVPCSACADLRVEVTELQKPGDIIGYGITTTTTEGQMLETFGIFRVRVVCNNKRLILRPNKTLRFHLPVQNNDAQQGLKVYYGLLDDKGKWKGWQTSNASEVSLIKMQNKSMYQFDANRLEWLNCNLPLKETGAKVCLKLAPFFTPDITKVMIVTPKTKSVAVLSPLAASPTTYCIEKSPANQSAQLVVIAKTGTQYWLGRKNLQAAVNPNAMEIELKPEQVSEEEIIKFLRGL